MLKMEKTMQTNAGATAKPRLFAREIALTNVALVIQFLLGMYINLYVNFPTNGPAEAWKFAWTVWPVGTHIILGTLLLMGGISLLIRAIRRRDRHWILFSAIAVFGLLLAYLGGERYITTLNDIASFLMSFGFLITFLGLNWGLYYQ
jgi:hypothetical protein